MTKFLQPDLSQNEAYAALPESVDVCIVFAHPDDEIAWFGAMIPSLIDAGKTVLAICMTQGSASGQSQIREQELRKSLWVCGLRHEPIWGGFPDCGYIAPGQFESLAWVWEQWGSRQAAATFMCGLYKRFQPKIIFTHNPFTGDYGHPNHMACAWACIDAFDSCREEAFVGLAQHALQQVYVCSTSEQACSVNWQRPLQHFNAALAADIALTALRCHQSQSVSQRARIKHDLAYECLRQRGQGCKTEADFFEKILIDV